MADLVFDLPMPPSSNHAFATIKGRRVKSKEYLAWRNTAVKMLRMIYRAGKAPVPCRVLIGLNCKAVFDCDNRMKPVLDALVEAGVLVNDHNRHVRYVAAYADDALAGCRITITPY